MKPIEPVVLSRSDMSIVKASIARKLTSYDKKCSGAGNAIGLCVTLGSSKTCLFCDEQIHAVKLTLLDMRMLNTARIPTSTHFVAPKFCVAPENRVGLCLCRFDACDELGLAPCMYCEQLRAYRCTN